MVPRRSVLRRAATLGPVLAALVSLASCGDDGPDDYSAETEAQFLATCVGSLGEAERSVCECSYGRIADEVAYDDFEDLDRRMNDDPDAELPDEIVDIVAACAADPRRPGGDDTTTGDDDPTTTVGGGTTTTEA